MRNYKEELCRYLNERWDTARDERNVFFGHLQSAKCICLFGAGQVGQAVSFDLADIGINVNFFCDNNKELWGKDINSIRCISPQELEQYKEDTLVLITTGYFKEISEQLESLNFKNFYIVPQLMIRNNAYWDKVDCASVKGKICELIDVLDDSNSKEIVSVIVKNWFHLFADSPGFREIETGNQYFPDDIIRILEDEIFVDVGAFDGDTIREFLSRAKDNFKEIIAYELDKGCYSKLEKNIKNMDSHVETKVILHNLGLYNEDKKIRYTGNSTSSTISATATEEGKVVRLSDHLGDKSVTFIKMDIEGAEMEALRGSEEIIKAFKPKLAICVYHKPSHLWEIPLYLKSLVPEYKIYLRHHSSLEYETVCYAVF